MASKFPAFQSQLRAALPSDDEDLRKRTGPKGGIGLAAQSAAGGAAPAMLGQTIMREAAGKTGTPTDPPQPLVGLRENPAASLGLPQVEGQPSQGQAPPWMNDALAASGWLKGQQQDRLQALPGLIDLINMKVGPAVGGTEYWLMDPAEKIGMQQAKTQATAPYLAMLSKDLETQSQLLQPGLQGIASLGLEQAKQPFQRELKQMDIEGQKEVEGMKLQFGRDQLIERILSQNPNATHQQIEALLEKLNAARALNSQEKGSNAPQPPGADPRERLKTASEKLVDAQAREATPEMIKGIEDYIYGESYSPEGLAERLGANSRLIDFDPARQRVVAALRAKFGTSPTGEERIAEHLALLHNEGSGMAGSGTSGTYGGGTKVEGRTGSFLPTEGYDVVLPSGVRYKLGSRYAGPGAGLFSKFQTMTPTFKRGTMEEYKKRAGYLSRLLEDLNRR